MDLQKVLHSFALPQQTYSINPFGSGHINHTYRVQPVNGVGQEYLLQKINHEVFRDVAGMMNNIERVTRYLREASVMQEDQQTLTLILANDGQSFVHTSDGSFWRVFVFMTDLLSYDVVESNAQIYEGAKSFGMFLSSLVHFPVDELVDTIPNFHNVIYRLDNLSRAIQTNPLNRVGEVKSWLDFIESVSSDMTRIQKAGRKGLIPLRVTHNDTKFNNVLLNQEGKGVCVIDLDTVMPGYVHYDFGDGVRTTVTSVPEDEADVEKIQVDLGRFEAFASGYLEPTRSILSEKEIELLPLSGALFAYLMGVRFLTDFIEGDVYYKIHFEQQNLQRAKAQLTLCKHILDQQAEMARIINQA